MPVTDRLATSLGRKDEAPNLELARKIAERKDKAAVKELVENLKNKDRGIQGDCIKVLYEVGDLEPKLVAPYAKEFLGLLGSKNNRLAWGAMTALDSIALEVPRTIHSALPDIVKTAESGSVITRDHAVSILTKLVSIPAYSEEAFALLLGQLKNCPTNQLPMYAENAAPAIKEKDKPHFVRVLKSRLGQIGSPSKRKRVEKVIMKHDKTPG